MTTLATVREPALRQAAATQAKEGNETRNDIPDPGQLAATGAAFVEAMRWPQASELMAKARERGLNTASPFELDLGRAIAEL